MTAQRPSVEMTRVSGSPRMWLSYCRDCADGVRASKAIANQWMSDHMRDRHQDYSG